MMQKGSKCKCKLAPADDPFNTNDMQQDFDDVSMNSSQDHNIDQQLMAKRKKKEAYQEYCSSFCKRIGPKDQRRIILECLKIDTNNVNEIAIDLNTECPPLENVPIQTVRVKCSANKLKRYIIDAKWWSKWCDYTNFDQNDLIINQLKETEGDRDQLEQSMQLNNFMMSKRFESTQLYQKPGRIENECLLTDRTINSEEVDPHNPSFRSLRENLLHHFDFEALSPCVWMHLYSWYSADT